MAGRQRFDVRPAADQPLAIVRSFEDFVDEK
jgi:hypothetical protein